MLILEFDQAIFFQTDFNYPFLASNRSPDQELSIDMGQIAKQDIALAAEPVEPE